MVAPKTNVTEPDSQLQSILKKRLQRTNENPPPTSEYFISQGTKYAEVSFAQGA